MKTKLALFLLGLFVVSCTSSRPVVRTTTKPKVTTKKQPVTQTKPVTTKPNTTTNPKTDTQVSLEATSNVKTYAEEIQFYVDNFKEIAKNNMKTHTGTVANF